MKLTLMSLVARGLSFGPEIFVPVDRRPMDLVVAPVL